MQPLSEVHATDTELQRRALDAMIVARCRRPLGHQMTNAVQGLYSGVEILARAVDSPGKTKVSASECVAMLRRQLDVLQQTLLRVLDDVAPQSGAASEFDVAAMLKEVARFLMSDAAVVSVRLKLDLPDSMCVTASQPLVKRILLAFFLDAIDAMRGGGELSVRVESTVDVVSIGLDDTRFSRDTRAAEMASSNHHPIFDGKLLRALAPRLMEEVGGQYECSIQPQGHATRLVLPRRP